MDDNNEIIGERHLSKKGEKKIKKKRKGIEALKANLKLVTRITNDRIMCMMEKRQAMKWRAIELNYLFIRRPSIWIMEIMKLDVVCMNAMQ